MHGQNKYSLINKYMLLIAAGLCFVSMVMSLIVSSTIFFNKELRETHPSMLICMMSLAEFVTCQNAFVFQINAVEFVCYLGLNQVYFNTFKIFNSTLTMELAIKNLVDANITCFKIFQQIQLCLNACLCIDIYFTFKNPFYPSKRRMRMYYVATASIVLGIAPYTQSMLLNQLDWFNHFIEPLLENREIYRNLSNKTLIH